MTSSSIVRFLIYTSKMECDLFAKCCQICVIWTLRLEAKCFFFKKFVNLIASFFSTFGVSDMFSFETLVISRKKKLSSCWSTEENMSGSKKIVKCGQSASVPCVGKSASARRLVQTRKLILR